MIGTSDTSAEASMEKYYLHCDRTDLTHSIIMLEEACFEDTAPEFGIHVLLQPKTDSSASTEQRSLGIMLYLGPQSYAL